ncbi:HU family DNA-binding protein [Arthrobacter castelli]|uniref:HU family DNA-binding protein n=1 Tax=Arthrobacter castelli TaxID=271431 RepID=UPI0003FBE8FB|nr:HU family DNA-binding protein [Arthrobacter castelli]
MMSIATTEGERVTKQQFVSGVSARTGLSAAMVSAVYEGILDELVDTVAGDQAVVLTGFGRFYRQVHKGHKVRFGKSDVEDYPVLKFSASRSVSRRLNPGAAEAINTEDFNDELVGEPVAATV